jgi:hypothetical protein
MPIRPGIHRSQGTVVSKSGEPVLPMKDAAQAKDALARMNQVRGGLSPTEKKHVARVATDVIGHQTPMTEKILGDRGTDYADNTDN